MPTDPKVELRLIREILRASSDLPRRTDLVSIDPSDIMRELASVWGEEFVGGAPCAEKLVYDKFRVRVHSDN